MEQLRQKVKELCKKRGWTQEDMAREMSISLSRRSAREGKVANRCPL